MAKQIWGTRSGCYDKGLQLNCDHNCVPWLLVSWRKVHTVALQNMEMLGSVICEENTRDSS
jgi:hypothetical protein